MHWYKRDPNAALTGMAELSLEERGAYNSLLDILYSRDGDLPDDDQLVGRIMRCNPRTWRKLKTSLIGRGKVWVSDGKLMAKRVEKELKEAAKLSEAQSNKARKRWEETEKPNENNDPPMPPGNASTSTTTSTTTSRKKERVEAAADAARPTKVNATRLSEDWKPSAEDIAFAQQRGLTVAEIETEGIKFRNYWTAKSGKDATKRNWARTWQNWILNWKGTTHGKAGGDRGRDNFRAALGKLQRFGESQMGGNDGGTTVRLLPAPGSGGP